MNEKKRSPIRTIGRILFGSNDNIVVSEGTRKHVARHIFFLLPSQPASGRACSSVFFYESQSFSPVPYINQKNRKKKKRTKPKQRKQEGRVSNEIFIMSPESKRSSNGS